MIDTPMTKTQMISQSLIITILVFLLCGCMSKRTHYKNITYRNGAVETQFSGSPKPGEYVLEDQEGRIIAKASGTSSRASFYIANYYKYNTNLSLTPSYYARRAFTERGVAPCVRIKDPRGNEMTGSFTMPDWQKDILHHERTKVLEQIREVQRQQTILVETQNWLNRHPELYQEGQCVAPPHGSRPANSCETKAEAQNLYATACLNAKFNDCMIGGMGAQSIAHMR